VAEIAAEILHDADRVGAQRRLAHDAVLFGDKGIGGGIHNNFLKWR